MRNSLRRIVAASLASLLVAPLASPAAAQQVATHTVQPGETLGQIASDAGVDSGSILRLNQIDDADLIMAGQVLQLPSGAAAAAPALPPAPTPVVHTVADGETLWSIAQDFSTTVDAIVQANSLSDANVVVVGSSLTIPGGHPAPVTPAAAATPTPTAAPAATPAPAPASPSQSGRKTIFAPYTIQPGETLSGIARQFNVSVDTIAQASGLDDPNKLSVGMVLKVPIPSRDHVVQAGETLYGIAAQEKVDLGSLIDFNNLSDPQMIRVGDVLVVPGSAPQTAASVPSPAPPPSPPPASPTPATPAATPAPSPSPPPATARPASSPSPTPKPSPTPVPTRRSVPVPAGLPTDGLVGQAVPLLGYPYAFGGSGPTSFDCSGLIWYAAKMAGKPLSRGLFAQYNSGSHPSMDDLKPGDLVFFQNTYTPGLSHDGIYIGNGQFINAANEVSGVTISNMNSAYWSSHYFGATRPS